MAEHPVVDASPVIVLAYSGLLDLLQVAGEQVIVPLTVKREIQQYGPEDLATRALAERSWLDVIDTGPVPSQIARYALDRGESAVLTWALAHPGCEAILDDQKGRRCALSRIPLIGTLGLLVRARQRGVSLRPSGR